MVIVQMHYLAWPSLKRRFSMTCGGEAIDSVALRLNYLDRMSDEIAVIEVPHWEVEKNG